MIAKPSRVVFDTNVFISAALRTGSTPAKALRRAFDEGLVLTSPAHFAELTEVLERTKFERQITLAKRQSALAMYAGLLDSVAVDQAVYDCRDPDDNRILALALCGRADVIVTGDLDLLSLHPWRGISILSPAEYLARSG